MDAFGAILCHRHSLTEGIYLISLAIHVVSWTRFAGCMSRPLFLDMVLSSRRLPSLLRVPASLVPRSRRYYEGATTSHLRISVRLFCSLPPPTSSLRVCVRHCARCAVALLEGRRRPPLPGAWMPATRSSASLTCTPM